MKPAISITENNTIILDCLNEHHDHVEIDVNDVLFLTILKDLVHIAFLMDKQDTNAGILESTGKFKKTNYELDDSKHVYFLNDLDWEFTVFKPILHPLDLPSKTSSSFICIENRIANTAKYVNFNKVAYVETKILEHEQKINFTHQSDGNIQFKNDLEWTTQICFIIPSNQDIQFKVHTILDTAFISLIKQQIGHERISDKVTQSNLIEFLQIIERKIFSTLKLQ
jgi:hypothetical protein